MDRTRAALEHRWWLLATAGSAQLMVVLDNSIVNVALPAAQDDLGFAVGQRQWVVTVYALTFGCLLLPGGRLGDRLGRRRAFVVGLVGFAAASTVGGAALGLWMLVAARAVQGAFAALLAPTALTVISEAFPVGRERVRAYGVLSAVIGSGAATGLVLGGVLTQFVGWRATMYVNDVFAAAAVVGAVLLMPRSRGTAVRVDLPGTALVGAGLFAVVFGLARAEAVGWAAPVVCGWLAAGVVLLAGFAVRQRAAAVPLLPLTVLASRVRVGAYVNRFTATLGNFAVVFFLVFLLQQSLGLDPLLAGVAMVPMVVGTVLGANVGSAVLARHLGARGMSVVGLVLAAAALGWLTRLSPSTSYGADVVGPLVVFGLGQGLTSTVSTSTATQGLPTDQAGPAAALVSVMQQVGGSVGTALLSSVAATAAAAVAATGVPRGAALVHGYATAFGVAALIFAAVALLCGRLLRPTHPAPETENPHD